MQKTEFTGWELPHGCGRVLCEEVSSDSSGPSKVRIAAIVVFFSPSDPVEWSAKALPETTGQIQSPDGKVTLGADPGGKAIVVRIQAGASPGWYDKKPDGLVPRG